MCHGSGRLAPCWEVAAGPGLEETGRHLLETSPGFMPPKNLKPKRPKKGAVAEMEPVSRERGSPRPSPKTAYGVPLNPEKNQTAEKLRKYTGRPHFLTCEGFRAPAVVVFGKRAAAAKAAAVATVKPLGPGRGTAQPQFRAPRADRPERI